MSENPTSHSPNSIAPNTPDGSQIQRVEAYQFIGPLPPPELLNQYDVSTRRAIVSMAKKQSSHRHQLENTVIKSNTRNEFLGMIFALIITVSMMVAGVLLLLNDKSVVGFLTIFTPAVFQGGNYIYNKRQENKIKKKEESEKN